MTGSTLNADAAPFVMPVAVQTLNRKGRSSQKQQPNKKERERDSSVASNASTVALLRSTMSTKSSRHRHGGRHHNKQKKPIVASEELGAALSSVEGEIFIPAALPLTRSAASELALMFEGL